MAKLIAILGVCLLVAGGGAYGVFVYDESQSQAADPAAPCPHIAGCCDTSRAALMGVSCCTIDEADQARTPDPGLEAVVGFAAVAKK